MKQTFILAFTFFFFNVLSINAQNHCGSVSDLNALQTHNPSLYQDYLNQNQAIQNAINSPESLLMHETVVIPVVVHILHNGSSIGSGLNLSMAQIESQIEVLNEDFRRMNADRTNTPSAFANVAADANIEFRLACIDPNGNPTNGVTRTQTSIPIFRRVDNPDKTLNEMATRIKFTSQGGVDAWDTNSYLNIWVCKLSDDNLLLFLGYAQSPFQFVSSPNTDGIVVNSTSFGRTGYVISPFHKGRIATHEVGHWLGLNHIFGTGNCSDDDVDDTPIQGTAHIGCPTFPTSSLTCPNGSSGDMFMNYMDVTNNTCMNLFTLGQRNRMRAVLFQAGRENTNYMLFRAVLPNSLSARFLYGNDFKGLKSFTVGNGGTLQVNGVGKSRFNNGVTLNGDPVTVQPNCGEAVDLNVENGGQFIIGEGQRVGTVKTGNNNVITIKSGATLRIANSSKLIVEAGSRLVINLGANINLADLESKIIIENGGELVINGTPTITGNGHFRFEQGNVFTLNNNALLRGTNRNTPLVVIATGATITVTNPRELSIENASVVHESGSLTSDRHIWLRNGATFKANNVFFDDKQSSFNYASFIDVENPFDIDNDPDDMDYSFVNCRFQKSSIAVELDVLDAQTTPFIWRNLNVEFVGCEFINNKAFYADRSYITLFDNCTLTNSNIEINHTYWLNIRNTAIRGSGSGVGIKSTNVAHFWFRDNSLIDQFTTGIEATDGINFNIIMTDQATIQRCFTGIHLNGYRFGPGDDLGLLHMDCARMIQNVNGIRGRDIIFSAYTRFNAGGATSNNFTRSPDDPTGLFIESLFDNRRDETDVWLHGNYWDGVTPLATPTVNTDWAFRVKSNISAAAIQPWTGTIHNNDTRTDQNDPAVRDNCGGLALRESSSNPLAQRTIVNINGVLRDVKIQQDAGWRKLSQKNLAQTLDLLRPVANLSNSITDTASKTVNHLVDVARAFTLSERIALRSAAKDDGWLPETIVGYVKSDDEWTLSPNPTNDAVQLTIKNGNYHLRVSNAIGQTILAQNTEGPLSVNVATWTNGIYLFELTDKATNKQQRSKIVVQH